MGALCGHLTLSSNTRQSGRLLKPVRVDRRRAQWATADYSNGQSRDTAPGHFVEEGYKLGNITETPMAELVASPAQRKFGQDKLDTLPQFCLDCDVRFACHGACPKDRFIRTPDGEPGLNYLCAGYKAFFHHVDEPMKAMSALLRQGQPPSELMAVYAARDADLRAAVAKAGRNDPCPCGSGRKVKHCHGALPA